MVVADDFDYATTQAHDLSLQMLGPQDQPVPRAQIRLYDGDPLDGGHLLITGQTDEQGQWQGNFPLPNIQTQLIAQVSYPGIPNAYRLEVNGRSHHYTLGGSEPGPGVQVYDLGATEGDGGANKANNLGDKVTFMGSYTSDGVPTYLTLSPDVVTQDILDLVANSLPEGYPVPQANPQYIADSISADTRLIDSAEVWVTFVHEGAGYKNVLGYYTYDLANPPQTKDDIDSLYVVFPNVSMRGSGGGLRTGDKVYLGRFSPNTGIGWFLIPNGWSSRNQGLGRPTGEYKFSAKELNDFTGPADRSHVVLLKNEARELLLLGMEDIDRPGGDQDFNDAVFYVTANPFTAVQQVGVAEAKVATGDDDDSDDVINVNDAYPQDPNRAFDLYFPGENTWGTLSFEDLWPFRGDYDFNDLVVDYQFQAITNTANQVTELQGTFILQAVGAGMSSGFGFALNVPASTVSSVTGSKILSNRATLANNGLEAGQSNAVVIVFDDGHAAMEQGAGRFINTESSSAFVEPDTVNISIIFNTPQRLNALGSAPFNPFIFTERGRGYEIHLPDQPPTDLADVSLFQTGNDSSDPNAGRYYKDPNNLPWVVHVPTPFTYPLERVPIIQAHLRFANWAQSAGVDFSDWYAPRSGYRSNSHLYR